MQHRALIAASSQSDIYNPAQFDCKLLPCTV